MQNSSPSSGSYRELILQVLQANRGIVGIILFYGIGVSLLQLAVPLSVQTLVNTLSFTALTQPLLVLSLLVLVLMVSSGILQALQAALMDVFHRKLVAKLGTTVAKRIHRAPNAFFAERNTPELVNRFFDVFSVHKSVSLLLTDGFAVCLQLVVGMLVIAFYHPFFIAFDAGLLILLVLVIRVWSPAARDSAILRSKAKYKLVSWLEQQAHLRTQANGRLDENVCRDELSYGETHIAAYDKEHARHFRFLLAQIVSLVSVNALGSAVFLGLGGWLVIQGELSLGQLVAAELIVMGVLSNIAKSGKYFEKYYDMVAASDKIRELIDIPREGTVSASAVGTDVNADPLSQLQLDQIFRTASSFQPRSMHTTIVRLLGSAFILFAAVMILAPWQQTSAGNGRVIALDPHQRIQDINATVGGRIARWFVQDGDKVDLGDPIAEVIDIDPDLVLRLQQETEALRRKLEISRIAAETAERNYLRQARLVEAGLSAPKEYEKATIEYKKLKSEVASNEASLAKAETSLSRQQYREVTAPIAGTILSVLNAGAGGQIIKAGDPVARLLPETQDLSAEIYVDGNDLSLIAPGRKARIQFEGWPAVQARGWPALSVGTFAGVVHAIDTSQNKNGKFRVILTPDAEDSPWPSSRFLRQQMAVQAWIQLDTVPLGYEVWRQINGFPLGTDDEAIAELQGAKRDSKSSDQSSGKDDYP